MIQTRHWLLAATIAALLVGGPALSAHAKTTTQHGNALATYNVKKYRTVKNQNLFVKRYAFQQSYTNIFQTSPTQISSTKGKAVLLSPTSSYP
ncbi:Extracellular protein [Levilactobacillus brevis]|nr:Extracellular protein [Levilactobacillus brevis]